ncbi:hypothetical protein PR048_006548 [Dryococelus australis]|uniref:Uncharacterized protein n=1 Tax=Dryococelus australis TaxID=614101 RepID=A0ABQ9IBY4_9NEOP|nr:hypothetical protein PR048_006548 [Dryococelus australis]
MSGWVPSDRRTSSERSDQRKGSLRQRVGLSSSERSGLQAGNSIVTTGPRWCNGQTTRLLTWRSGFVSQISPRGNRAGWRRWSTGFLVDLPFPPPLHSGAASYTPDFTVIGSLYLVVPEGKKIFHGPTSDNVGNPALTTTTTSFGYQPGVYTVHDKVSSFEINIRKKSLLLPANILTGSLSDGATVAERLPRSPPTKANRAQSPAGSPDFRKWESCRTIPLVSGFSRRCPVSHAPSFRRRSIFTSTTLIGSQDLAAMKIQSKLEFCSSTPLPLTGCKWSSAVMQMRGEREIPEKTRRPAASSGVPAGNRTRFASVDGQSSSRYGALLLHRVPPPNFAQTKRPDQIVNVDYFYSGCVAHSAHRANDCRGINKRSDGRRMTDEASVYSALSSDTSLLGRFGRHKRALPKSIPTRARPICVKQFATSLRLNWPSLSSLEMSSLELATLCPEDKRLFNIDNSVLEPSRTAYWEFLVQGDQLQAPIPSRKEVQRVARPFRASAGRVRPRTSKGITDLLLLNLAKSNRHKDRSSGNPFSFHLPVLISAAPRGALGASDQRIISALPPLHAFSLSHTLSFLRNTPVGAGRRSIATVAAVGVRRGAGGELNLGRWQRPCLLSTYSELRASRETEWGSERLCVVATLRNSSKAYLLKIPSTTRELKILGREPTIPRIRVGHPTPELRAQGSSCATKPITITVFKHRNDLNKHDACERALPSIQLRALSVLSLFRGLSYELRRPESVLSDVIREREREREREHKREHSLGQL